jgi:hypothetical protein
MMDIPAGTTAAEIAKATIYFGPVVASQRDDGTLVILSDAKKLEAAQKTGSAVSGMVISDLRVEEEAQISHKLNGLTQDERWTVCGNQEDFLSVMMADFDPGHCSNKLILTCGTCRLNKQEGF